jgi:hypothetical protein
MKNIEPFFTKSHNFSADFCKNLIQNFLKIGQTVQPRYHVTGRSRTDGHGLHIRRYYSFGKERLK